MKNGYADKFSSAILEVTQQASIITKIQTEQQTIFNNSIDKVEKSNTVLVKYNVEQLQQ